MTNREIDKEIAEKVMEWKLKKKYYAGDVRALWCDSTDEPVRGKDWFCPSEFIKDAWLVVEKMKEKGLKLLLETFIDGYTDASFVKTNRMVVGRGWDKSAPLAICKAALKAINGR